MTWRNEDEYTLIQLRRKNTYADDGGDDGLKNACDSANDGNDTTTNGRNDRSLWNI